MPINISKTTVRILVSDHMNLQSEIDKHKDDAYFRLPIKQSVISNQSFLGIPDKAFINE